MTQARRRLVRLALCFLAGLVPPAGAQTWPARPIHLVVPYPAGGGGDIHGRVVAEKLAGIIGQAVVIENRAGGSGVTGSDYVAKAPPDGYILLLNTNALVVSQITGKSPFNVLTDLAPLSLTMTSQNLLVARPALAANNVKELVAFAKANPGKLSYGASGLATPMLSMELMKSLTGSNILFVPYKGDTPGIIDLIGGQTDLYVTNILPLLQHVRAGKIKALAVTSKKRASSLPEVPTMEEAGVPGFEVESWFGLFAPAGTPAPVVERLNAALARVVALPEVQQKIGDTGGSPLSSTPEQFRRRIQADLETFGKIVKDAGIKAD